MHVISRVNRPADNHWVVRFCEALGAGASVHQVKHRHQKGEVARSLGITIGVDDAYECVHSMALACPNWQTGILFGGRPTPQGSRHDAWVLQRTIVCGDWGQVASALGCDVPSQVWRWFGENGPPRQPHNATRLREAWKLCQVGHVVMLPDQPRIGQGKTGPRKTNDEEMPAASAEVKTEGEAAGSEATAPAPEAIAPAPEATAAPAEVIKTEGQTAGVASAASAEAVATTTAISPEALAPTTAASAVPSGAPPAQEAKETAASAVQEGTTAGPAVSAAPASSAAAPAEDKPDWDPLSSSSSSEEEDEEEEEEEDEDDDDDDSKGDKTKAAPPQRGYAAKSKEFGPKQDQEPQGIRLRSVLPRRRAVTPPALRKQRRDQEQRRQAMEDPPGGKEWVHRHGDGRPSSTQRQRRRRHRRRHRRQDEDEPEPSPSWQDWNSWNQQWLEWNKWNEEQRLRQAVDHLNSRLEQVERRCHTTSEADPGATRTWWGGRDPNSKWTAQKKARAEAHQARGGARPAAARVQPAPTMCSGCGRNEPGAYCSQSMCRQCCKADDCPQHNDK